MAIAEAFARAGANVVVNARSENEVADAVDAIEAQGGTAIGITADVTRKPDVDRLVAETLARWGRIDILVNNAGVGGPFGPLWEVDIDEWRACIEIDLVGPAICTQAVLPGMIERGSGRIINVASAAGLHGRPYMSPYTVAKTGLIRLTEVLANELEGHGISTFVIHPGAIHTRMEDRAAASEAVKKWLPEFPAMVKRNGIPAERPAELCVALASGVADCLSGRFIDVSWDLAELLRKQDDVIAGDVGLLRIGTS